MNTDTTNFDRAFLAMMLAAARQWLRTDDVEITKLRIRHEIYSNTNHLSRRLDTTGAGGAKGKVK